MCAKYEGIITGRAARRLVLEALAHRPAILRPATALAAHALAVVRARTEQPLVHVAREVIALAERTRYYLGNIN